MTDETLSMDDIKAFKSSSPFLTIAKGCPSLPQRDDIVCCDLLIVGSNHRSPAGKVMPPHSGHSSLCDPIDNTT